MHVGKKILIQFSFQTSSTENINVVFAFWSDMKWAKKFMYACLVLFENAGRIQQYMNWLKVETTFHVIFCFCSKTYSSLVYGI